MQAQEVPPYAGATLGTPKTEEVYGGPEHAVGAEDQGHKKKSVLGKVKDKAKKLKSKIKKPKSHRVAGDNNNDDNNKNDDPSSASSSDEEDSGSDPHQQDQIGERIGEKRDVVFTPGRTGAAYEAIPDPHVGVQERFGQLRLGGEPESAKLHEEVPSAPGQESAGVSAYLASNDLGQSAEASRGIPKGKDLLVTPAASDDKGVAPMDYEQPSDVSKTSDNAGAWYTPTSADSAPDAVQQKPLKDRIVENAAAAKDSVAATAASGAGALGLASYSDKDNTESRDTDAVGEAPKTTLDQAKENVLGASPQDGVESGVNKPSLTSRAAGTVTGLKDTIAWKLGYGSNKNLTGEADTSPSLPITQVDAQNAENKSVLQKVQERAAGATGAATSKLGYGENQSPTEAVSEGVNLGDNKSYTQKAYEAAYGAKDAVASKLGYGSTTSPKDELGYGENQSPTEAVSEGVNSGDNKSYTQKAYEAAHGAKDAVASKLGYGSTSSPKDGVASATEGATEGDNKSYLQKAQETAVGAKETVASKAQETAATAREVVGSKLGYPTTDAPAGATEGVYGADQNVPTSTAVRFHPGEEDRALSQLITEKMSTGAATVKDTLLRPFNGAAKSGPPTPITTPPPSSATAVMADPEHTTVSGTTDVPHEEKPGIVGKVTGVVSSLLGTSASGKKTADEAVGKAVEDTQA